MAYLNVLVAFGLVGAGWSAIMQLLQASMREDATLRRDVPANRVLAGRPRVTGPLNIGRPDATQMSDLNQ